jgi:hypothetical protein
MTQEQDKKDESTKTEFEPIISSERRGLKSAQDLKKPNAYRNDWTEVAEKAKKHTLDD